MIIRYVRKKGHPVGCVVALDSEHLGYSLCHKNDQHKFTKRLARRIAERRAEIPVVSPNYSLEEVLTRMNRKKYHEIPNSVLRTLLQVYRLAQEQEAYAETHQS